MLTSAEKTIIENFACGDHTLRNQAVRIYHAHLRDKRTAISHHLNFMSEVDNPVPDLGLRAMYRRQLHLIAKKSPD